MTNNQAPRFPGCISVPPNRNMRHNLCWVTTHRRVCICVYVPRSGKVHIDWTRVWGLRGGGVAWWELKSWVASSTSCVGSPFFDFEGDE
jgi:hypothetical protein